MKIYKAEYEDLNDILKLQYLAYQSEAALFGTDDIPPLKQTIAEVEEEYHKGIILKMVSDDDVIIGSVRAKEDKGTAYIGKLMVHPDYRCHGYGSKLLSAIEDCYPGRRYELFTSTRSVDNIRLYNKMGYDIYKKEQVNDELIFVYMEKIKNKTKNPWEEISINDYENHMSLGSVMQLQTLNKIMKSQFDDYDISTAMILGVAGGNGLEHVDKNKYSRVFGIDINEEYLKTVSERYSSTDMLGDVLECIQVDLIKDVSILPDAELIIANLLIEYIGYEAFAEVVNHVKPRYVSCVIQINTDENNWVSDSPYLHAFDGLEQVHHQMEESELEKVMEDIKYTKIKHCTEKLPNGKALVRMDFTKN